MKKADNCKYVKVFLSLFAAFFLLAVYKVPAQAETPATSPVTVSDEDVLNVLFIGNSFSIDTSRYLYDIAEQTGYRIRYKLAGTSCYKTKTLSSARRFFALRARKGTNYIRVYALGDEYIASSVFKKAVKVS